MRCLLKTFQILVLTRAFAVPHVCDSGIDRKLIVLGVQLVRAGARAPFGFGGGGCKVMLDGRDFDLVVTPCDVRSLGMAPTPIDSLLLLCLG